MDNKQLTDKVVDDLFSDIQQHGYEEGNQLADWLMANQLTKGKKTIAMMESWEKSPYVLQRRVFWYYQGRLRWVGQKPPENNKILLDKIEKDLLEEEPGVQWAMNFTAVWIGIFDQMLRERCVQIGEDAGLYKDEVVAKNCSPNYLPALIEQEVRKRHL